MNKRERELVIAMTHYLIAAFIWLLVAIGASIILFAYLYSFGVNYG